MLSEITVRKRTAEKTFSHPIQCPAPWKAPLFSSAPNPGPWPREGEKPGLEENGWWFTGECPEGGEPYPAEPRPHPCVPQVWLNNCLGLRPPCPCSRHHREPPYRGKTQESDHFPALGKVKGHPGKHLVAILCVWAIRSHRNCGVVGVREEGGQLGSLWRPERPVAGATAMGLGLGLQPWWDTAPGGQLQILKIKVCHLVVSLGLLGTTTQLPPLQSSGDPFMTSEIYIHFFVSAGWHFLPSRL